MRSKQEIVRALARGDEERMLLAGVLDKLENCRRRSCPTETKFLDMHQRELVRQAIAMAEAAHESVFWGGYEDAERVCCIFYPDYWTAEDAKASENSPFTLLRAQISGKDELTHRDYLGALMGLGLERACIGDILVRKDGADLFVLEEVAEYVLTQMEKAGRRHIGLTRVPLDGLIIPETAEQEGSGSVASLRLDCVLAQVFSMSRTQAQEAVSRGLVFVNNVPCLKADREVAAGERLTLRGRGRARITELGGKSRKGRQFIHYLRS